MLVGKINPSVKFSVKDQLLVDPAVISAEWMIVTAERMPLGVYEVRFSFVLGELTQILSGDWVFKNYYSEYLTFTKDGLSDWGTDDSIMLHKVATKIGIQVVEVLDVNLVER